MADEQKNQAPAAPAAAAPEQPAQQAAPAPAAPQAQAPTQAPSHPPQQRPRMGGDRGPRPGGDRRPGGREGGPRKFFRRKKVCKFCVEKIDSINYKDVRLLSQFVAERGKIVPRRLTGVCTPHQRRLTAAIKQARNIALLPFAAR
jgi:small subunit ribosomal protein S18